MVSPLCPVESSGLLAPSSQPLIEMVSSLVQLCARQVVSDHGLSAAWLSCVPRELYRPLLDAAFAHCRPLAVGELVQRWPERTLSIGGRTTSNHDPPNRLCVQALLLAVVRGLTDKRYSTENQCV